MNPKLHSSWKRSAAMLLGLLLTGCASYHPNPLPTAPDLAKSPQLTAPVSQFELPGLAPQPVSSRGLNATTVMLLAVMHNPGLKAARLQAGVAGAQLLQAGLLPNPQLTASFASSARNYGGTVALDEQIQSWITRGAAKAAAATNQKQVNLNILWQEWQVAGQAQQLFLQIRTDARLHALFTQSVQLLQTQFHRDRLAVRQGNALATTVAADLAALNQAESSENQLQLQINLARHRMNALLGLQPQVRLHLIGFPDPAPLTASQIHSAVAALPHRRADLLALQAGYQSQEENLRRAVLAQFPAMTAGFGLDRDPIEGINDLGPHVTLSLPLFNHNQGQIALERATRAVLRQTYQARLDSAVGQADQIWNAIQIQRREQKKLTSQLSTLRQTAAAANKSMRNDNLDAVAYVALESTLMSKQAQEVELRSSIAGAQATLRMLLGLPFQTH